MALSDYICKLADGSLDLEQVDLFPLSDLARDEVEELKRVWGSIEPKRRRNILTILVEKAQGSIRFDFNSIFLMGLHDPDEDVRFLSIYGLWEYEERSALTPLIDILRGDESPRVQAAAAEALGRYSSLAEEGKLLSRDRKRLQDAFFEALRDIDANEQVRGRALEGVAYFNDDRVRGLIQSHYSTGSVRMRRSAVVAMGRNGDPNWLDTIVDELSNVRDDMRVEAAKALGELGEEAAVPHLVHLVQQNDDLDVQLSAIEALGNIGGRPAEQALTQVLESGDASLQETSREALGHLGFDNNSLGPAP